MRDASELFLEKTVLVKENSCSPCQITSCQESDICLADDRTVEEPDPSCLQPSAAAPSAGILRCQYHVVYSHSYSVPVLFFNVCKSDGSRLSLEEVWRRVPHEFQQRFHHHKWATLTQQEHPLLGSPFFMLHPCHTATLMSQVPCPQDKRYYLVKWLSSVGPVVGLHLPPAYGTAFGDSPEETSPGET
ncbi:ubiquitin-like-conjugating enzyme ATG10 isoform X2 [Babylonia areolata]|uniref:ubiquitin-like-conjugating enzyme ATG10 isoform X2 n=1 Tax=Babylonia areolata TaxID=304850 RepID=UPI003FD635BD